MISHPERLAVVAMIYATAAYALNPLWLILGESAQQPLALAAAWRIALAATAFLWLATFARRAFARAGGLRALGGSLLRRTERVHWIVLGLSLTDTVCLSLATTASDVPVVIALYSAWPLATVLGGLWWLRRERSRRRLTRGAVWRLSAGACAIAAIAASEHGTLLTGSTPWAGAIALALLAAVLSGAQAVSVRIGIGIASRTAAHAHRPVTASEILAACLAANALGNLLCGALFATAAYHTTAEPDIEALITAGAGIALITGTASIAWRSALVRSANPELGLVNAMTPALALAWLGASGLVEVEQPLWLIGAVTMLCIAIAARPSPHTPPATLPARAPTHTPSTIPHAPLTASHPARPHPARDRR